MYSEFGAYLIRPGGEAKNRLTHLVFPETTLSIPGAGRSLRGASDLSFPQAKLMAAVESDDLFAKVMADNLTADKLTQRVSLILSLKDVFFNSDLWDYFSKGDQAILSNHGFGPGMSFERWAIAIKNYTGAFLNQYENNGRITTVHEMPITLNQRGHVGTLNSYYQMPGLVIWAIIENQFSEQEGLFEIGSAHIHPEKEYSGISEAIASQLGERIAQMTLSPADVKVLRGSIDQHNQILQKHGRELKKTEENFVSIVGVNNDGIVTDIRHHDLALIENVAEMRDLNDRTIETFASSTPDIGLIRAHYEFFSDPSISSDEFGGDIGEHVGDPDFKG